MDKSKFGLSFLRDQTVEREGKSKRREEEEEEEEEKKKRRRGEAKAKKVWNYMEVQSFCMNFHAWMVISCLQT